MALDRKQCSSTVPAPARCQAARSAASCFRMPKANPTIQRQRFYWLAQDPCLDFLNTVHTRLAPGKEIEGEWLTNYDELIRWSFEAGLLSHRHARRLRLRALRQPRAAQRAFEAAKGLRELLGQIFYAVADQRPIPSKHLSAFSVRLSAAMSHAQLVRTERSDELTDSRYAWGWQASEEFDRPVWSIVRFAADLLASNKLARVRVCSGSGCGWVFLDTSPNATRRWCDMKVCGNRAKARRFRDAG